MIFIMDIEKSWQKALSKTEIRRSRIQPLLTSSDTRVSYVLLSESTLNHGDTVVRKGEIIVGKPSLFVPPDNPQFHGFDFDQEESISENMFINFLLVRGVRLPSFIYDNKTQTLDIFEGNLQKALTHYSELLQKQEDVQTGLLIGPEDCWQFSLLIFICSQISRGADQDIKKLLDDYKYD